MEGQLERRETPGAAPVPNRLVWRTGLPVLESPGVILREVQASDAPALVSMLGSPEVAQFLPPGPTTREEFETFIAWAQQTRRAGRYISLAVVPRDLEAAVGIFQIWPLQPDFGVAEWGFVLGRPFWGTGLFLECARLVIDFAIEALGVRRLEARAAAEDLRGNAALWKIGAVREVVMRKCFPCADGEYRDHVMWSIRADAWEPLSVGHKAAQQPRGGVGRSFPSEHTGAISRSWPLAPTPSDRSWLSSCCAAGCRPFASCRSIPRSPSETVVFALSLLHGRARDYDGRRRWAPRAAAQRGSH